MKRKSWFVYPVFLLFPIRFYQNLKGEKGKVNDYPYTYLFIATYKLLYRWVREKVAPPHAAPIELDIIRKEDGS